MVLKPAEFLVETVEAGLGEVLVYVEDPEGHTEEVRVRLLCLKPPSSRSEPYEHHPFIPPVLVHPPGPSDPQQRQEEVLLCGLPPQSGRPAQGTNQSGESNSGRHCDEIELVIIMLNIIVIIYHHIII